MSESAAPFTFHGNGKFLITGEYLVLKGAKALALPLNKGQSLTVQQADHNGLSWQAHTPDGHWFQVAFDACLNLLETDDKSKAETLQKILKWIVQNHPSTIEAFRNKSVVTQLEFNPHWGWGSSSTLIYNLAQWLNFNPFTLLNGTLGGSGYDVACASARGPIFYQLVKNIPIVDTVSFNPSFHDHIWFVYTGQKQNSSQEVKRFLTSNPHTDEIIQKINLLSEQFVLTSDLHEMRQLMLEHEQLIGQLIHRQPIQQLHFQDFDGSIKSMGAWGGDYIMAVSDWNQTKIQNYFKTKGLSPVFSFKDIILNN